MGGIDDEAGHGHAIEKMEDLSAPEQLLICTYRRWIVGMRTNNEAQWNLAWSDLAECMGSRTTQSILSGLQSIILGIGTYARRPARLHPPCCGFVGADEISFITLIGACQRREHKLSRRIAEWMVTRNGTANMLEGAGRIANALAEREIYLPDRPHRGEVEIRPLRPEGGRPDNLGASLSVVAR